MNKFGRNYKLYVQNQQGETVLIQPPFTIEIDISRNNLSSSSQATVRIFNLSKTNRDQLSFFRADYGLERKITLLAGYGEDLSTILDGNIVQAWSVREGTNYITTIQSNDGGFAFLNAKTNSQYSAGTSYKAIIRDQMKILEQNGVKLGAIGLFDGKITRSQSFSGNTTDILRDITGGAFHIDNNTSYVLKDGEYLAESEYEINSSNGLLNTPVREPPYLIFDMLFEPKLYINQYVNLNSSTASIYNGNYKVVSLKHRGVFSETVGGSLITSVGLWFGLDELIAIKRENG